MSDKDESKTEEAPPAADKPNWETEAEKWKALARKHEGQAKANKIELDQLRSEGDTSKSEMERLADRVSAAEERAARAESEQLRFQVAAAKKLTPAQAKRLQGTTLEELEADADDLLEAFGPKPDKGKDDGDRPASSGRPREALRAGADNTADDTDDDDPRAIVAKIPRSRF